MRALAGRLGRGGDREAGHARQGAAELGRGAPADPARLGGVGVVLRLDGHIAVALGEALALELGVVGGDGDLHRGPVRAVQGEAGAADARGRTAPVWRQLQPYLFADLTRGARYAQPGRRAGHGVAELPGAAVEQLDIALARAIAVELERG